MLLEEEIVCLLKEKGFQVTTAESCSGGLLAGRIINVDGASEVFREGFVTYSNEAKERRLLVSHKTLATYGAVSEQTAKEMAEGAAQAAQADVALSVTGIAGPEGGTEKKPVGLVYIGCYFHGETCVKKFCFTGDRAENRACSVEQALELLKEQLVRSD